MFGTVHPRPRYVSSQVRIMLTEATPTSRCSYGRGKYWLFYSFSSMTLLAERLYYIFNNQSWMCWSLASNSRGTGKGLISALYTLSRSIAKFVMLCLYMNWRRWWFGRFKFCKLQRYFQDDNLRLWTPGLWKLQSQFFRYCSQLQKPRLVVECKAI